MKNKWKKAAAFAVSLAIVAGNSAGTFSNMTLVKASEANLQVSETAESESVRKTTSDQGADESYFDAETQTLHLKGYVRNGGEGTGIILPDGIVGDDVKYLVADKGTVLPEDCSWLMYNLSAVETVDFKNADSSNVTNMAYMFAPSTPFSYYFDEYDYDLCLPLRKIDLTGFDTSKVTDMRGLFKDLIHLQEIDVSSFNTSNVTNMSSMFYYCNIESLDLSNFRTSSVTSMFQMFLQNTNLVDLNISSFNTKSVETMEQMFSECYNLRSLDLSNFDTSSVTSMFQMFFKNTNLVDLNISSFNTKSVETMQANVF